MTLDLVALKAAKLRYRELYKEISQIEDEDQRSDILYTHRKLGIFLETAVGHKRWRAIDEEEEC